METGIRTREYLTIHRNLSIVAEALGLAVDPGLFAQKLCEVDLVTSHMVEKARIREVPASTRVHDVILAVQTQLKLDPSRFSVFISILKSVHQLLAEKLMKYYGKVVFLILQHGGRNVY